MPTIRLLLCLLLFLSCTSKYLGTVPDYTVPTQELKEKEAQKFLIKPYSIPLPHYNYLNFQGKRVAPKDLEHVLYAVKKDTLSRWQEHHWGAYIALITAIPAAIFLANTITDFNMTNLFLFGASAGAFTYGSLLEQNAKNHLIRQHNRELRIKLDLIKHDF